MRICGIDGLRTMSEETLAAQSWKVPEGGWPELGARAIHVWSAHIDPPASELELLESFLSEDELKRANRFCIASSRNRFIAARGQLRILLARYLATEPEKIDFVYGDKGKPKLSAGSLHFNVSHSEDHALYAVSAAGEIGVDIEKVRPVRHLGKIAERFFSATERHELLSLPETKRLRGFFICWTKKEAVIKALGTGIYMPLDSFDVSLEPGSGVVKRIEGQNRRMWRLCSFEPGPGLVGALATEQKEISVEYFSFPSLS